MSVKRTAFNVGLAAFDTLDGLLDLVRSTPPRTSEPKRILIWTVDRLGDVVRTTPAIRALAARWPNAEIEVVAAARASGVFVDHPQVSALHVIGAPHDLLQHRALARKLRGRDYDLGILAEVEPAWAKLGQMFMRRLAVPYWARFDLGLRPLKREVVTGIAPNLSWSELFLELAVSVGGQDDGAHTSLGVSNAARTEATEALQGADLSHGDGFIVCHPGTSALVIDRAWSADRYAAALDALHDAFELPVVVTGLAAETPLAQAIKNSCTRAVIHDFTAKLSFAGLTGVLDKARLTLINDTGPMHVSNALGTPTVVILGPTAPEVLGITASVTTLVRAHLPCQPCAWHTGLKACTNPLPYECLTAVTVDQVVTAASARLNEEVAHVG
jgi:heptosyltransferase-2/heptosyltransferase-3